MNLILAADKNWNIGNQGDLLCYLKGDLAYFKEKTLGKTLIMGRKTFESLPGKKGLPNRRNIVLTRNKNYQQDDIEIVNSEEELFDLIKDIPSDEVFLIGGGELYKRYYNQCENCYITKIYEVFEADTSMINLDEEIGFEVEELSEVKEENGIKYQMFNYKKKGK